LRTERRPTATSRSSANRPGNLSNPPGPDSPACACRHRVTHPSTCRSVSLCLRMSAKAFRAPNVLPFPMSKNDEILGDVGQFLAAAKSHMNVKKNKQADAKVPTKSWQDRLLHKYYLSKPGWVDERTQFYRLIAKYVRPGSHILEIGPGPSNKTSAFLATMGRVTGLDVDAEVAGNEYCHHKTIYDGVNIPYKPASFDAVVSEYVCEHLAQPGPLTKEIHRVLRPAGVYIFRTPNLAHYVALVASLTPQWFHVIVANALRNLAPGAHDPYPTFYRMNRPHVCRRFLTKAAFRVELLRCIETYPTYGLSTRLMFYPMVAWERIVNSTSLLEGLRANIWGVAVARDPDGGSTS